MITRLIILLLLFGSPAVADPPNAPFTSCVNLSNALEAEREGNWGYTIRDADIARIADAGFDAVRIPIRWSAHADTEPPYAIDPVFLDRVDHVVETAMGLGLHAIINVHHYEALYADPATETERFLAIWRQVSEHFASRSEQLIFEFLNEPRDAATTEVINDLNRRLVSTIRQTNPDRWLIYSGSNWGGLGGMIRAIPPENDRVIASFHYYEPFAFTNQGALFIDPVPPTGVTWGTRLEHFLVEHTMARAAHYGAYFGVPVLMGEFGVYQEAPLEDRAHWIGHVRTEAEKAGLAWCHWGWAMRFGVYDDDNERWIDPVRDALLGG